MDNTSGNVQIFTRPRDWESWETDIRFRANVYNLWKYLDPSVQEPEPFEPPKLEDYLPSNNDSISREDTKFAIDFHSDRMEFYWKQKKAMWEILQVIRETVAPSLQYLIKRKYTARECLVVLKKHVSQHHAQIVNEIDQDLQKLYKGPQHKPITQFLLEYQGTLQEAFSYGLTEHTREPLASKMFLKSLPRRYSTFSHCALLDLLVEEVLGKKREVNKDVFFHINLFWCFLREL
ncbi:hypothetical protein LOZ61_003920 [Ophidiomyces ophidiicola]|uniref:Uncharacterized protein n=1 Tax=Ophidiomyces ophidiicola TaxID=1387563 RepID=A0ACB8UNM2_9EURO|nr:hypothetical protein LOZ61_003920 [Ophidiomyces ophidiicola]KAI1921369.1 hypothetical protein LOZ60_006202 [Ophidiomyces ophidiicola]KAI2145048.1 hypothetical protein LOZ27_003427 [Ophidiomyces ophidiicola]KAI2160976.1 hypothetical protein LOZ25_002413 [Ophidiomyces ophidiicola]KAI2188028.1 hypothetical protein LOZ20_006232 [Ophidiomyces ophidiicola]